MRYELAVGTLRNGATEVDDGVRFLQGLEAAMARGGRVVQWMQSSACHPQGQLATVITAVLAFGDPMLETIPIPLHKQE